MGRISKFPQKQTIVRQALHTKLSCFRLPGKFWGQSPSFSTIQGLLQIATLSLVRVDPIPMRMLMDLSFRVHFSALAAGPSVFWTMNQGTSPPRQSSMIKAQRSRPPAPNNKKCGNLFEHQKNPPFENTGGHLVIRHRRGPRVLRCWDVRQTWVHFGEPVKLIWWEKNGMFMMSPSSVASPACHFIPKWPQGTMPVGSFVQLLFTSFSRADCHALTHVDGCSTRTNWNIPSGKYVWLPVLTLHPLDRIVWVIYNARPTSNWFNIQRPRRCCKKETSFRIEASQSLFQTCHSQPLDSGIVSPRCSFKFYRKTSNSIVGSFSQVCATSTCYILLFAPSQRYQYSRGCMTRRSCQTILAATCSCSQPQPKPQQALPETQHKPTPTTLYFCHFLPTPQRSRLCEWPTWVVP